MAKIPRMSAGCGTFDLFMIFIIIDKSNNMINDILNILTNAVISISDLNGNVINYKKIEIKNFINKNAPNKNTLSIGCFVDGKQLSIKTKKVTYKCSCGEINTILLKRYVLKPRLCCPKCKEKDETKRKNHSLFFKTGKQEKIIGRPQKQKYNFDNESDYFKKQYYIRHFTEKEFKSILPKIIKIDGIEIINKEITYFEHEEIHNNFKYRPYVLINGEKHNIKNIYVKCPECGRIYKISDSRNKKNKLCGDLKCVKCKLFNKRYPRMKYVTIFGDTITYQGSLELKFIKKCEENGIKIINGPKIPYFWNLKWHKYLIDFMIPDFGDLIEIKGEHIWHKESLKNGKWKSKENSAKNYANVNNLKYNLLFSKDIDDYFATHPKR